MRIQVRHGKEATAGNKNFYLMNDRAIHGWQGYAGTKDRKTTAQHLQAVRGFAEFLRDLCFRKFTTLLVELLPIYWT